MLNTPDNSCRKHARHSRRKIWADGTCRVFIIYRLYIDYKNLKEKYDGKNHSFDFALKNKNKFAAEVLLTVQHNPHLGLEILIGELPQGKGLSGRVLQQAESNADGVFWRETGRVDEPAGGGRKGRVTLHLQNQKQQRKLVVLIIRPETHAMYRN